MSRLFASGGQSIGASASAPVLPMNIQGWFPLRLTGLISLKSSPAPQSESISSLALCLLYCLALTSIHDNWKDRSLVYTDLCQQSYVFLFNTLSRFVITFLPRSNCLPISWLQSLFAVILEPKQRKSTFYPSTFTLLFAMKWWDWMPWSLLF